MSKLPEPGSWKLQLVLALRSADSRTGRPATGTLVPHLQPSTPAAKDFAEVGRPLQLQLVPHPMVESDFQPSQTHCQPDPVSPWMSSTSQYLPITMVPPGWHMVVARAGAATPSATPSMSGPASAAR